MLRCVLTLLGIVALSLDCLHRSDACAADPAIIRLSTTAKDAVYVGQRVTVVAELFVQGTFDAAPAFDLPKLPGALLMQSTDRPTIGSEEIDGATYVTQRHELYLVCMRAGTTQIPTFVVRVAVKSSPDKAAQEIRLQTEPLAIEAKMPPGAEHLSSIISSKEVTAEQTWVPQPGERVPTGTSFTRQITLTAADVPSMAFPPLPGAEIDHVKTYPKPPVVEDKSERGEFTGRRVDAVVYVCATPGKVQMPALTIPWWNLDGNRLEQIKLPGLNLEIEARAEGDANSPPDAQKPADASGSDGGLANWLVAGGVLLAMAAFCWKREALAGMLKGLVFGPDGSDRQLRKAMFQACRRDDPVATYRAIAEWCESRREVPGLDAVEEELAALSDNPAIPALIRELQDAAINRQAAWRGAPLAAALRENHPTTSDADRKERLLPPLNPC